MIYKKKLSLIYLNIYIYNTYIYLDKFPCCKSDNVEVAGKQMDGSWYTIFKSYYNIIKLYIYLYIDKIYNFFFYIYI